MYFNEYCMLKTMFKTIIVKIENFPM